MSKSAKNIQIDQDQADLLFHDIMHSNISIKDAIPQCNNERELSKLCRLLYNCGELDEIKYNTIIAELLNEGKMEKFLP